MGAMKQKQQYIDVKINKATGIAQNKRFLPTQNNE
jgi:hypothetical protein